MIPKNLKPRRTDSYYVSNHKKNLKINKHSLIFDINESWIIELSRKPKTRNQIAEEYIVSVKILNKWFTEKCLDIKQGLICPADLRIIYATLGQPHFLKAV